MALAQTPGDHFGGGCVAGRLRLPEVKEVGVGETNVDRPRLDLV